MRAVLDEGVPRRVAQMMRNMGYDVSAFPNKWKGMKNGKLLAQLEEAGYGILLTCDRSLSFQQNIDRAKMALIVLPAQLFDDLVPFAAEMAKALDAAMPGRVFLIGRGERSK